MHKFDSICILRLSAIGDVCHALSSVQAIQRQYPNAKISWVIGKVEALLLKEVAGIEFIVFDKSQGFKAYKQLRQQMKGRKFDVLLHMQLALRANIAALCIPAKIKIGFPKERCKELHSLVVNRHIQNPQGFHVLDGFRDFAREIGVEDSPPLWNIPVTDASQEWAKEHLPREKYIVISPAASNFQRNWLNQSYADICDYLRQKGYQVILTGGPSAKEKELSEQIIHLCQQKPTNLTAQTNLQQLLLTLKQAELVIAPDSGPAHMAATQGTPVIGLYAHSNPKRTGPYLYQQWIADAYTAQAEEFYQKPIEQIPWGARLKGSELMALISVPQVKALVDSALLNVPENES